MTENETTTVTDTTATETVAETTVQPLENMIATTRTLQTAVETAQLAYEESLAAIARDHGATYQFDNQWYQIRTRGGRTDSEGNALRPITYECKLDAEPKTWLKGRKKGVRNKAPEAAVTMAAAADSVVPETGDATVIE